MAMSVSNICLRNGIEKDSGHERERHQTSDGRSLLADHQSRRQSLIWHPLQINDVQQEPPDIFF